MIDSRISLGISVIIHILMLLFLAVSCSKNDHVHTEINTIPISVMLKPEQSIKKPTPYKKPAINPKQPLSTTPKSSKPLNKSTQTQAIQPESIPKPESTPHPDDLPVPELLLPITPIYPKLAENYEWEGTIELELTISKDGLVTNVSIIKSTGHTILDTAFITTAKKERYKPKRSFGEALEGIVRRSYTFQLK